MENVIHFLDTSCILNGNWPKENDYISSTVLRELENIKTAGERKSYDIKHQARKAVRYFLQNPPNVFVLKEKDWEKIKSEYSFSDTGDNRILAELLILNKELNDKLIFLTSDICFYLLAKQFNINTHFCSSSDIKGGVYKGYQELFLSSEELNSLYSNPEYNIANLLVNEYGFIKDINTQEIIDIIRWNGFINEPIDFKPIKNKFMEPIHPKDIYQKITLDLLQRRDVPVKLIQGMPGSGKDYLMTSQAIDLVLSHKKEKIVFMRNLIDLKDAPQLGYLSGDLDNKLHWGADPIRDIVGGEEGYNWLEENNIIEQVNIGFIRGRSIKDSIIYVSEAQNLTESIVQSIISRAGEGTEVWINGDLKQIDKVTFNENNGMLSLQQNLKGNSLFGATYLPNTHRSKVAELSGLLSSY